MILNADLTEWAVFLSANSSNPSRAEKVGKGRDMCKNRKKDVEGKGRVLRTGAMA